MNDRITFHLFAARGLAVALDVVRTGDSGAPVVAQWLPEFGPLPTPAELTAAIQAARLDALRDALVEAYAAGERCIGQTYPMHVLSMLPEWAADSDVSAEGRAMLDKIRAWRMKVADHYRATLKPAILAGSSPSLDYAPAVGPAPCSAGELLDLLYPPST